MPVLLREYFGLCPDGACNVSLLNEGERKLKSEGYTILSGILQRADALNGNGRIYRKKILEREMDNYQKLINENRALGELDHSDNVVIELKNSSHMILRTWWEGNDVMGTVKILKHTPSGQILEGLIKDGVQLGISSRGLGSVTETKNGIIVEEDFQLLGYDFVSDPSVIGAFMYLNENKTKKMFTKADKINRLLNDITRK